jgi:hypothetical protein
VALEEGLRLVANLEDGAMIGIGRPVEVYFDSIDGVRLPQFRLADGTAS